MNPIGIIRDAYTRVSSQVSEKVDRLLDQDRDRLRRRKRYEGEITRGRGQRSRSADKG